MELGNRLGPYANSRARPVTQLAEIAREYLPDLPILFITGYAETAAMRGDFLGTNRKMTAKLFQIELLSGTINKMLK